MFLGVKVKNEQLIKIMLREIILKLTLVEEMIPGSNSLLHKQINACYDCISYIGIEMKRLKDEE